LANRSLLSMASGRGGGKAQRSFLVPTKGAAREDEPGLMLTEPWHRITVMSSRTSIHRVK
jgi:hypothetical protein